MSGMRSCGAGRARASPSALIGWVLGRLSSCCRRSAPSRPVLKCARYRSACPIGSLRLRSTGPDLAIGPDRSSTGAPRPTRRFSPIFLTEVVPHPFATVAAGHAAGYVLVHAADAPGSAGRLCLVAPTWRGPLPTMVGRRLPLFARLGRAGDHPVVGPIVYRLNVNRPVVRMMARGHVYADPGWLNEARMAEKLAVIRAPGARHASIRFVAGELDPVRSREAFLSHAGRVVDPILVVFGAGTPPKSKAEMEVLAALPNVGAARLAMGKLSIHEEYPDEVAAALKPFLVEESP